MSQAKGFNVSETELAQAKTAALAGSSMHVGYVIPENQAAATGKPVQLRFIEETTDGKIWAYGLCPTDVRALNEPRDAKAILVHFEQGRPDEGLKALQSYWSTKAHPSAPTSLAAGWEGTEPYRRSMMDAPPSVEMQLQPIQITYRLNASWRALPLQLCTFIQDTGWNACIQLNSEDVYFDPNNVVRLSTDHLAGKDLIVAFARLDESPGPPLAELARIPAAALSSSAATLEPTPEAVTLTNEGDAITLAHSKPLLRVVPSK